ncbi:MAG: anti-sigma factor family protein, partial [Myxococcaceae bacterium]
MTCPTREQWEAFLSGTLDEEEVALREQHLDTCPSCRRLTAAIVRETSTASPEAGTPPRRKTGMVPISDFLTSPSDGPAALTPVSQPPSAPRSHVLPPSPSKGWVPLAIAGAAIGIGVIALLWVNASHREDACRHLAAELPLFWGEPQRNELRAAYVATQAEDAEEVWRKVDAALNTYATELNGARVTACKERRKQPCLDQLKTRFEVLRDVLTKADATTVESGTAAVNNLWPLARCAEAPALSTETARFQAQIDTGLGSAVLPDLGDYAAAKNDPQAWILLAKLQRAQTPPALPVAAAVEETPPEDPTAAMLQTGRGFAEAG